MERQQLKATFLEEEFTNMPYEESISILENLNFEYSRKINLKCNVHDLTSVALNLNPTSENYLFCPLCLTNGEINLTDLLFFEHVNERNINKIMQVSCYKGFKEIYSKIENRFRGDLESIFQENNNLMMGFELEILKVKQTMNECFEEIKTSLIQLYNRDHARSILETENFVTERLNFRAIYNQLSQENTGLKEFLSSYQNYVQEEVNKLKEAVALYDLHKSGLLIQKISDITKEIEVLIRDRLSPSNLLRENINPISNERNGKFYFNPLKKSDAIVLASDQTSATKGNVYDFSVLALDLILKKEENVTNPGPVKWKQEFGGIKKKSQFITFGIIEIDKFIPQPSNIEYIEKNVIGVSTNNGCYNMTRSHEKFEKRSDFTIEFSFDPVTISFQITELNQNSANLDFTYSATLDPAKTYIPIVVLGYPGNTVKMLYD